MDDDVCGECPPEFKDQLTINGKETDVFFKFVRKRVWTSRLSVRVLSFCEWNDVPENLIRCEALPCFSA